MWIWELPLTDGGNLDAIIAQAKEYGIGTVYVKSGDGTSMWSQFNATLVSDLHEAGLRVCAWQYVYGVHPLEEAQVGARAVKEGANCLVIDAESQYQGRYAQAQEYVGQLRVRIGSKFPLALAGFPYVDYHPSFPYSVFLGTNGAQYNAPQMYWRAIGVSVATVFQHTYEFNEIYQRPIFPLGQLYDSPPASQVLQFRQISRDYGATGLSWWDWQSANASLFSDIAKPVGALKGFVADKQVASVGLHAVGDLVVWAQEHLWNTPERVTIDGDYGVKTEAAVAAFQTAHGIPATGVITAQTWAALLEEKLPKIRWTIKKKLQTATIARVGADQLTLAIPRSADAKQKHNELGGDPGMGREREGRTAS